MTPYYANILAERLHAIKIKNEWRQLTTTSGIDFCSSDYLGFATDPLLQKNILTELAAQPSGSSASRLLRGNLPLYEAVEQELAEFVGQSAAIVFPSGYQANLALLSSLLREGDCVYSDELNHASLIDGIRLTKAERVIYPHRDTNTLFAALTMRKNQSGLQLIVTESIFSMDGTTAPLTTLIELAQQFKAGLIIDEAHATGVWGRGLVHQTGLQNQVLAAIYPAGKALGVSGAFIAGSPSLKDYLINFARPFIFSTAPIPAIAVGLQAAIRYYQQVGGERSDLLRSKACAFRNELKNLPWPVLGEQDCPIIPIVLGDSCKATACAEFLQQSGFDVRAIRPPTVPKGQARLRITIKWHHTKAEINQLYAVLSQYH